MGDKMIAVNRKKYPEQQVKLAKYLLMILGIAIIPIGLLVTFIYPLIASIALAVGVIILYMSNVYARALKDCSVEFNVMILAVIALLVIIPPVGIIFMYTKKPIERNKTKVIATIFAVAWTLLLVLCYTII